MRKQWHLAITEQELISEKKISFWKDNQSQLTQQVTARIENEECLTISDRILDRVDHHRQITADVVHDKEEDADDDRAHFHRNQFDENGEEDAHPHLGEGVR